MRRRSSGFLLALLLGSLNAEAGELRVAVASNFSNALRALEERFETLTDHDLQAVFGSTGKHYAQIHNGAPFDAFLAADRQHPEQLETDSRIVPGSRFTYAIGQLVLWSPIDGYVDPQGHVLTHGGFRYLAMANPRLAPYGRAAREVLNALGLWEGLSRRIVQGENVAQAFQFVHSGNAEMGFVALSQLVSADDTTSRGSVWRVPVELHGPIEQQAVLLRDAPETRALARFLKSDEARTIIRNHGYSLP